MDLKGSIQEDLLSIIQDNRRDDNDKIRVCILRLASHIDKLKKHLGVMDEDDEQTAITITSRDTVDLHELLREFPELSLVQNVSWRLTEIKDLPVVLNLKREPASAPLSVPGSVPAVGDFQILLTRRKIRELRDRLVQMERQITTETSD